ncbi:MAG: histone, partial [Pseudomonadota bacterium]
KKVAAKKAPAKKAAAKKAAKKPAAKKSAAVAPVPPAKTSLSPQAAWPFPTGSKP